MPDYTQSPYHHSLGIEVLGADLIVGDIVVDQQNCADSPEWRSAKKYEIEKYSRRW